MVGLLVCVLNVEVFVVIIFIFDVWVGEFKFFVQVFFYEVQLCIVQKLQVFVIDYDFYVFVFKYDVFWCWFVNKFQYISYI